MARCSGKTDLRRTHEIDSFCSLVNYSITILGQEFDPDDSYWVCEGREQIRNSATASAALHGWLGTHESL